MVALNTTLYDTYGLWTHHYYAFHSLADIDVNECYINTAVFPTNSLSMYHVSHEAHVSTMFSNDMNATYLVLSQLGIVSYICFWYVHVIYPVRNSEDDTKSDLYQHKKTHV